MIASFGDEATADLFHGRETARVRRYPPDIVKSARNKLELLNNARDERDLRVPAGNRLEVLQGGLASFMSVRINVQWRVIFRWQSGNAHDVRVTDYH